MKKSTSFLRAKWRSITYMQAAMALLIPETLIFLYLLVKAILTGGGLSSWEGGLGVLGMILSLIGIGIPLYGHFIVRMDGRKSWKLPFFLHLGWFFLWIVFYCAGL
jgi:hypothetical protein